MVGKGVKHCIKVPKSLRWKNGHWLLGGDSGEACLGALAGGIMNFTFKGV